MDKAISYKITEHDTFQYEENFFPKCLSESYIKTDNLEEMSKNLNISFFSADLFYIPCSYILRWWKLSISKILLLSSADQPSPKKKKISEIILKQLFLILTADRP